MEMICENDEMAKMGATACHNNNNINNKRCSLTPPAMELISDESSLDDSTGSRASNKRSCHNIDIMKKRVSWDQIHTREYALVVGDHPMCQDGLPVSLGWDHLDCSSMKLTQQQQLQLSERRQPYEFPKRLSYEERRNRLLSVSNLTLDQIKNDEIDLVVRTLRESWEEVEEDILNNNTQLGQEGNCASSGDAGDSLMGQDDPLADIMGLDDVILPGMALEDGDLGDISDFEWTDEHEPSS